MKLKQPIKQKEPPPPRGKDSPKKKREKRREMKRVESESLAAALRVEASSSFGGYDSDKAVMIRIRFVDDIEKVLAGEAAEESLADESKKSKKKGKKKAKKSKKPNRTFKEMVMN
eukprot:CAMPEP_0170490624 /NCGR_PEP_ID=MMETSP0208-20121228/8770_1 /TAXON_ID=197538 /ORGANISM="Strombidium inclinatum, Strain S3" /LENGTH=114 /DNA_ID=CAMNT_0010766065 /DNA_START=65 /DNA_END=409 /DNA_ORIENTATION=-